MFEELRAEFARFDALAVGEQNSEERKAIVRRLESGVRNQTIALTESQFRRCRDGEAALGRVLAYLFAENERVKSALADRRKLRGHGMGTPAACGFCAWHEHDAGVLRYPLLPHVSEKRT
jgi:hypothetical protein